MAKVKERIIPAWKIIFDFMRDEQGEVVARQHTAELTRRLEQAGYRIVRVEYIKG